MARTVEALSPAELREAVAALWRVRPPIQGNLFYQLHDTCCNLYSFRKKPAPQNALSFAISDALSALGFPVHLSREHRDLALSAEVAAARLHTAFTLTQATRIYLSPLNGADDFPELKFGRPNRIARLTGAELEELVDLPRLRRINATWTLAKVFSEFTWLVIKQTYPLDQTPAERAIPLLFERGGRDWGEIAPHRLRLLRAAADASAVEDALFAMLLAPWEDWVDTPAGWWRPFEVPWVYEVDDDLFRRPPSPPSADALSWDYMLEESGEEVFVDPNRVPLKDGIAKISDWLNNSRWADVTRA
jgi:hypothetical protein